MLFFADTIVNDVVNILEPPAQFLTVSDLKQQIGFVDWTNFSDASIDRNIDVFYGQYYLSLAYDSTNPMFSYVGLENTDCDGGIFLGMDIDGTIPVAAIKDKVHTKCAFQGYTMATDMPGHRWDPGAFRWNISSVYRPQDRPWYKARCQVPD